MFFKPYPTAATTPNRKARKSERNKVFVTNRKLAKAARKERRLARQEATNEIA
jgi:hypothetical protein